MTSTRTLHESEPCPNCGDPTPGNYCPACGQHRVHRRVSLRHFIADVLDDQLSVNAALRRTIPTLLRPGELTREYLAGRIARYIPPFRLYLIASFLFFLALQFFGGARFVVTGSDTPAAGDSLAAATPEADTVAAAPAASSAADGAAAVDPGATERSAQGDTAAAPPPTGLFRYLPQPVRERVRQRLVVLGSMPESERTRILQREVLARAPVAAFLLVPVFAALLYLLYLRGAWYYIDHFVFALHVHSTAFLAIAAMLPLHAWPLVQLVFFAWLAWYMVKALHRVYRQSLALTLVKFMVLAVTYWLLLLATMLVTLVVALLLTPV